MKDNVSAFDANEYDDNITRTLPYYQDFYQQITEIAQAYFHTQPLSWLDIGCGTGKMAELALAQMNVNKFTFCDCSAKMLDIARKRFNSEHTAFHLSDIRELSYNQSFDVITAIQVNHYLPKDDRALALKNCNQALKSGGMFLSVENFAPFTNIGERLYLKRWKSYQLKQGKDKDACNSHISRYKNQYFPITLSECLDNMKHCGFETTEFFWLSYMQVGVLGIK